MDPLLDGRVDAQVAPQMEETDYDEVPAAGHIRYAVLACAAVCSGSMYLERYAISSSLAALRCTYDWSSAETGAIVSTFFWGYLLSMFPVAFIAQRLGKVTLFFGGCRILSALCTISMPLTSSNIVLFCTMRVLQGIAQGGQVVSGPCYSMSHPGCDPCSCFVAQNLIMFIVAEWGQSGLHCSP
jgi:sugar phosphate permease